MPETGSETPVPALSKMSSRAKAEIRSKNDLTAGSAQKNSMWDTKEGDQDDVQRALAHDLLAEIDVSVARVARSRRHAPRRLRRGRGPV